MSTPDFPRRLPYPPALHLFKQGFTLAAGGAVLIAIAFRQAGGSTYVLLGLLALVWVADWIFGRPMRSKVRKQVQQWLMERYDTPLSDAEAIRLTSAAKRFEGRVGDWCSEAVNLLYQNETGESSYIEMRLVRHDGRWFLYSPDYGIEVPRLPDEAEAEDQDLSILLSPLMGEVMETGGMFFLNAGDEFTGKLAKMTDKASGKEILLLWTDQLRADLWRASAADHVSENLRAMHIAGEGLVQQMLPRLAAEGIYVGINWETEGNAYPAEILRAYLERYF